MVAIEPTYMTSHEDEYNVNQSSQDDEYNVNQSSQDDVYNVTHEFYYGNETEGIYEFYAVPQIVFVSILSVFIIVGNSCVLAAIRLSATGRKSRMNFFIMHLAIADLLVGLMVSLADLAGKITIEWYAGNAMCKIIQYAQAVVTYSSTYMLVSLSIDRYDAVARPMNFSRSGYQGRFLVYMAWIVSFLLALPSLFIYEERKQEGKRQCWVDFPAFWHWQFFFTAVAVVTFLMPALIIATCYIAIIYIIWSKGQSHEPHCPAERTCLQGGISMPTRLTLSDTRRATGRGIIPQAKIRTIKMTLIIVIVFVLCWSPYFLYNLLDIYELLPVNNPLTTLIQSAGPLNSAANPIIYGIFSTRICKNLRRIPMPECLRNLVCNCKETKRCNRFAFRGRSHKFMASQTTDPTQITFEAQRKSNQGLNEIRLSPLKPSDRRYASLITKRFLDHTIFADTASELLKRRELKKKHKFINFTHKKWISDKFCNDYEMSPLKKKALCHIGSSESEDSTQTSDSSGRIPSSKRVLEIKLLSERNEQNMNVTAKQIKDSEAILNSLCRHHEQYSSGELERKDIKLDNSVNIRQEHHKNMSPSKNQEIYLTGNKNCEISHSRKGSVSNSLSRQPEKRRGSTGKVSQKAETCLDFVSQKELEISDSLARSRTASDSRVNRPTKNNSTGIQGGASERCLANRRPSGVPSVRRRLTPDENAILSNIVGQLLSNEESTIV